MLEGVNKGNLVKILAVPLVYVLLADYQIAQGFVFGLLASALFVEIH